MHAPRFVRLLHDSLLTSAERFPDKVALVTEGAEHTYAELLDAASRLAQVLRDHGLERGDRVAIYQENGWATAVSVYGALLAGGVMMVINPQTKADKLAYMLDDSEAAVLLADTRLMRQYRDVVPERPALRLVLEHQAPGVAAAAGAWEPRRRVDGNEVPLPVLPFEATVRSTAPIAVLPPVVPLDLAALIYTSGSTGNPKGVMMTHQNMVFTQGSLVEYLRLGPDERILNVLPLAFDYGLYQLLMCVYLGATLVLEASFSFPAAVMKRIDEARVTVFPGVPTVFATVLSMHRSSRMRFDTVTRVTNTAAHLPDSVATALREIFPNALVYKMYGLTECKRVCYLEPELIDRKPGSVGRAIPGTEVFLLDDDGHRVAPGEPGVLHVRGPHVMLGYWRKPELTAEMLVAGVLPGERVLCTHDRFKQDEDGLLYFLGRTDDIIKTRAEKVSPTEVENVLHGIDGILEAAVIGVPDELLGEAVHAYVVVAPGAGLNETAIRKHCMARMESFMVPARVFILPELPKTDNGKVRKKSLRDAYRDAAGV